MRNLSHQYRQRADFRFFSRCCYAKWLCWGIQQAILLQKAINEKCL